MSNPVDDRRASSAGSDGDFGYHGCVHAPVHTPGDSMGPYVAVFVLAGIGLLTAPASR